MRHHLSLEIPLVAHPEVITIRDTSRYTDALTVECSRLQVKVPGFVNPVAFDVDPGFVKHFDGCLLGIQQMDCNTKREHIPDGIYVIRYMVNPTAKVFVEYFHLRLTSTWEQYYRKIGSLTLGDCDPSEDQREKLNQFQLIRSFLETAKAKVEYCHELSKGMQVLNHAQHLLQQVSGCTSCGQHYKTPILL